MFLYANSCFSILFRGDGSPSRTTFEKRARTTWTPVNKVAQPTSWCRKFHVDPSAILFFVCLHDPLVSPVSHISSIPTVDVVFFSSIKMSQTLSISFNFQLLSPTIYSPLYIYILWLHHIYILYIIYYIYIISIYIYYIYTSLSVVSHVPSMFHPFFQLAKPIRSLRPGVGSAPGGAGDGDSGARTRARLPGRSHPTFAGHGCHGMPWRPWDTLW